MTSPRTLRILVLGATALLSVGYGANALAQGGTTAAPEPVPTTIPATPATPALALEAAAEPEPTAAVEPDVTVYPAPEPTPVPEPEPEPAPSDPPEQHDPTILPPGYDSLTDLMNNPPKVSFVDSGKPFDMNDPTTYPKQ